jgi:RNA polymerase sigma-70 factor (ECF subfamily)
LKQVRIPSEKRWLRIAPASGEHASAPLNDDALIEAVMQGDVRRAAQLHNRLIQIIESTVYRVCGRYEPDHDDLVQATFEQVVVTIMQKRFARACSLTTWASTLAAHIAFKALRSRARQRRAFDRYPPEDLTGARFDVDLERSADVGILIEQARQHLAAMDHDKATTVLLHDVLGHELAEIAVLTNVSVAAAQSRLVRGRRELYGRMEAEWNSARRKESSDGE